MHLVGFTHTEQAYVQAVDSGNLTVRIKVVVRVNMVINNLTNAKPEHHCENLPQLM